MSKPRIVIDIGSSHATSELYKIATAYSYLPSQAANMSNASSIQAGQTNAQPDVVNTLASTATGGLEAGQPPAALLPSAPEAYKQPKDKEIAKKVSEPSFPEMIGIALAGLVGGIGGLFSDPYGTLLEWFGPGMWDAVKANPREMLTKMGLPKDLVSMVESYMGAAQEGEAEALAKGETPDQTVQKKTQERAALGDTQPPKPTPDSIQAQYAEIAPFPPTFDPKNPMTTGAADQRSVGDQVNSVLTAGEQPGGLAVTPEQDAAFAAATPNLTSAQKQQFGTGELPTDPAGFYQGLPQGVQDVGRDVFNGNKDFGSGVLAPQTNADMVASLGLPNQGVSTPSPVSNTTPPSVSTKQTPTGASVSTPPVTPGMPAANNTFDTAMRYPGMQSAYDSLKPGQQSTIQTDITAGKPSAASYKILAGMDPKHQKTVFGYQNSLNKPKP